MLTPSLLGHMSEFMPTHFTIDHKTRFVDARFDGVIVLKDVEDL